MTRQSIHVQSILFWRKTAMNDACGTAHVTSPWDRRPKESAVAHEALLVYLNMGSKRSVLAVAASVGKAISLVRKWSATWKWVDRALVVDSHAASVAQEARDRVVAERAEKWERRRLDDTETAYKLGMQLHVRAAAMLEYPLTLKEVTQRSADGRETAVTIKPAHWTMATANQMCKTSVEIRMMACDVALADVDSFDAAAHTPEECQRFMSEWQARQKARRESRSISGSD